MKGNGHWTSQDGECHFILKGLKAMGARNVIYRRTTAIDAGGVKRVELAVMVTEKDLLRFRAGADLPGGFSPTPVREHWPSGVLGWLLAKLSHQS